LQYKDAYGITAVIFDEPENSASGSAAATTTTTTTTSQTRS